MPSDDGNPYDLPKRGDGFEIICKGCRKQFVSRGLRCCSTDCERQYRERQEIEAIVAEVGGELPAKRKCEQCGGDIPRYQGVGKARKEVRKDARYCSPRCRERAKAVRKGPGGSFAPDRASEPLVPQRLPIVTRKSIARRGGHSGADGIVNPFDNLFGDPSAATTLAEADVRHVMRRAQRLNQRGRQPPGVAEIRARAAEQTGLAAEINDGLRARDVVRARFLIEDGAQLYGHGAMVDAVQLQARQDQQDRMAEHYPAMDDIEDGWLDDEPR